MLWLPNYLRGCPAACLADCLADVANRQSQGFLKPSRDEGWYRREGHHPLRGWAAGDCCQLARQAGRQEWQAGRSAGRQAGRQQGSQEQFLLLDCRATASTCFCWLFLADTGIATTITAPPPTPMWYHCYCCYCCYCC